MTNHSILVMIVSQSLLFFSIWSVYWKFVAFCREFIFSFPFSELKSNNNKRFKVKIFLMGFNWWLLSRGDAGNFYFNLAHHATPVCLFAFELKCVPALIYTGISFFVCLNVIITFYLRFLKESISKR